MWKRPPPNGTDGILLAITGQDAINFIQSYISSGKTGVKFALITTDAAAVIKAIKGQKIDFYGSASYDRRNTQLPQGHEGGGLQEDARRPGDRELRRGDGASHRRRRA